ncbi:uncharacterized protein ACBR49_016430 isoform 2-T2 [Aulostomus maculatus]
MSRPRSQSPSYRRFPWEERNFDPYKVLAELDGSAMDRSPPPRDRRSYYRESPEGQRRSPPYQDPGGQQRQLDQEEFYRRRPSPHSDTADYGDRRFLPQHDGGSDSGRHRGGFREDFQSFESWRRSSRSPPRLPREKLPPTPKTHLDHSPMLAGTSWRREEQVRGRARFRDLSPGVKSDDQRGAGRERGRKSTHKGQQRDDLHLECPPFKRHRREMDDPEHLGFRNEEEFGQQRYSVDTTRDTRGGLPHGDSRHSGSLAIEHTRGGVRDADVDPPRWEQFDGRRDRDFDRRRSPRPMSSLQECVRVANSRLDVQEDIRGRHPQDNWRDGSYHETRRNPQPHYRPNTTRYNRDGPTNQRGRRGRFSRNQGGRPSPPRNQPHPQQSSQGFHGAPREPQRAGFRPQRDDSYEDAVQEEPKWAEEGGFQQWERDRSGSPERHLPREDLDPKMPRQRGWNNQKSDNMTVVTEETLTIKVDMSRPVNQKSSLCYSSDRQLSLDLVNVGRQRLDFLPMLEHSGTFRETATHTGTFAQEIITLVHQVKELYFRGDGITLNERFSASQKGGFSEDDVEELTLVERLSSSRGCSLNLDSLLDEEQPLVSRLGAMQQPMRGPGDLRHDLERKRQERLEGVKVTILGNHQPLGPISDPSPEFSDQAEMEDEGFYNWPAEQNRRWEGIEGPRRGDQSRLNSGPQRRNSRSRLGPLRRQNHRNNPAGHQGQNW